MDIMEMYAELLRELIKHSRLEQLLYLRDQLKYEMTYLGKESRLMTKYNMVSSAIKKVMKNDIITKNNESNEIQTPALDKELIR